MEVPIPVVESTDNTLNPAKPNKSVPLGLAKPKTDEKPMFPMREPEPSS
jgi:hypothetical protein